MTRKVLFCMQILLAAALGFRSPCGGGWGCCVIGMFPHVSLAVWRHKCSSPPLGSLAGIITSFCQAADSVQHQREGVLCFALPDGQWETLFPYPALQISPGPRGKYDWFVPTLLYSLRFLRARSVNRAVLLSVHSPSEVGGEATRERPGLTAALVFHTWMGLAFKARSPTSRP